MRPSELGLVLAVVASGLLACNGGIGVTVASSYSSTTQNPSSDPSNSNKPEFVFGPTTQILHQGLVGIRFQFAVVDVGFQAAVGGAVQTYTLSLALDF